MAIAFRPVLTDAEREAAYAVRFAVFVDEQRVPRELEIDEHDAAAFHVAAWDGARCVATGRLYRERDGRGRIGRMAVCRDYRARGVGRALVTALERHAQELGCAQVVLSAQISAIGFYERAGYTSFGERFLDAGIEHTEMKKPLEPRAR